jgi:hypothetical protein
MQAGMTSILGRRSWKLALLALFLLFALGLIGWWQRQELWARYCVYQLAHANNKEREKWTQATTELRSLAITPLVHCLEQQDTKVCANAKAALVTLGLRDDGACVQSSELVAALAQQFHKLSSRGQQTAIQIGMALLTRNSHKPPAPSLLQPVGRMLTESSEVQDEAVHAVALAAVVQPSEMVEALAGPARELVRRCVRDQDPKIRSAVIRLAACQSVGFLEPVGLLLDDPAVEVRREAMLAVAPHPEVIATDDLLKWLHDTDSTVRSVCEASLRSRGLNDDYLRLGRLLTDDNALHRMQVLEFLRSHSELDPSVWLRRLSHDPVNAVRAAAIRVASDRTIRGFRDRLEQMAQNDQSPTVRQLAQYHLLLQSGQDNRNPTAH